MPADPTDPSQGYLPFSGISAAALPSSAQELYDSVMGKIEPELMSKELPLLEEKYRNETPKNARLRAERYKKAFALYDVECERYMTNLHGEIGKQRHEALRQAEKSISEEDQNYLHSLDSQLSSENS